MSQRTPSSPLARAITIAAILAYLAGVYGVANRPKIKEVKTKLTYGGSSDKAKGSK